MRIELRKKDDSPVSLQVIKIDSPIENEWMYELFDSKEKKGEIIVRNGKEIILSNISSDIIANNEDVIIQSKLDELLHEIIDVESSGTDAFADDIQEELNPYNPDDIKVRNDKIPITLLTKMINDGDLILNPDFQRNLVWDRKQKSRLIESILLRIPLPMFYFSEDKDGKLIVVDGLQRINTIYEFMNNKFALQNLQYLKDACDGRYYSSHPPKEGLEPKYLRWFNLTSISANIIDPSSPAKVKYDIFRRINTGGKTLNNQEIRNCFTGKSLRDTLKKMSSLESFQAATCGSIKNKRMEDFEVALRFMLFYTFYEKSGFIDINEYDGNMESSLDSFTEDYSQKNAEELSKYIDKYDTAMKNAEYLFGAKYAFRKIKTADLTPSAPKQLINKALFVCSSILLANYNETIIKEKNEEGMLKRPLAELIENDPEIYYYLSYGTNGWKNLVTVFQKIKIMLNNTIAS